MYKNCHYVTFHSRNQNLYILFSWKELYIGVSKRKADENSGIFLVSWIKILSVSFYFFLQKGWAIPDSSSEFFKGSHSDFLLKNAA